MRRGAIKAGLLAGALAMALPSCSSSHHATAPTTLPSGPTSSSSAPSSTTATSTTAAQAAIPFDPESFTAISSSQFWVLGTSPCSPRLCTTILHTTDGGGHFAAIPAPPAPLAGPGAVNGISTLAFADGRDGYAVGTWSDTDSGALFATHDRGTTWRPQQLGPILAFATAAGMAYVVTATCTSSAQGPACSSYRLRSTGVTNDTWTSKPLPITPPFPEVDLTASSTSVWIMAPTAPSSAPTFEALARSTDRGRTFTVGHGPCYADLPGSLDPVSAEAVWAVCPTGMLARVDRSTNGGLSFSPVETPEITNGARIAPRSAASAVLAPNDATSSLLLTLDSGATWSPQRSSITQSFVSWIGFTNPSTGAALVQSLAAVNGSRRRLLRTVDSGRNWTAVSFAANS